VAVIRTHHYAVEPADLDEPEAIAAMSLVRDATAANGEIVDER
jgi:hypothetical protein